jgi:hypothetical protein
MKIMRTAGGIFYPGQPAFARNLGEYISEAIKTGDEVMIIVTHHFSGTSPSHGCAGYGCDTTAAFVGTSKLCDRLRKMFPLPGVNIVHASIDTDNDSLRIHSYQVGPKFDLHLEPRSDAPNDEDLLRAITVTTGIRSTIVAKDLAHILRSNHQRSRKFQESPKKSYERGHQESAILFGSGFGDWYSGVDAFVCGPYERDHATSIRVAAGLILERAENRTIDPQNGILLMTSAILDLTDSAGAGVAKWIAGEYLRNAVRILSEDPVLKNLLPLCHGIAGVMNAQTKYLQIMEEYPSGQLVSVGS